MKKKIIAAVCSVVIAGLIVMSAFLAVEHKKIGEYETMPLSLPDGFTVTAHTGCDGTEENSVEFLQFAIRADVEIIEFDVHFDKDGNPVLAHDAPKGGEVTLEEAFDIVKTNPDMQVNVDIKDTVSLDKIEKIAEEKGVLQQIFFTGVKDEFLGAVQEQTENIPYFLNVDVKKRRAKDADYLEEICDKVKQSGAIGINFNYKGATRELVDYFRNQGLLVSVWTVDGEKDMHEILSISPDNITTRNTAELRQIINERSAV